MTRFEKMEGYPEEIQGRFNSFITTQFDDSLSVEMQIRSLIKWISSSRELINDIVDYINLFIEMFDERLQEEIVGRLNEWLADGTLAQIINNDVFDMKADKIFVDSEIGRLDQKDEDLTTHIDSEIGRLDQKDEYLTTHIDSEIGRLDQKDEDLTTHIDSLEQNQNIITENKRNKEKNIIHLKDFPKLEGETDDQHINRALQSLDGSGFESWGTVAKDGTLVLEGKTYYLSRPIFIQPYQTLKGAGHATVLNMENSSSTIIDFQKPSEVNYNYGVTIENLTLLGNNLNIGIELRDSSHVNIKNVTIYDTFIGIQGTDVWLTHFDRVTVRNYKQRGEYGFKIDKGTSNIYTATWASHVKKGYQMWTWYSTMNSPGCDDFTEYAYDIGETATLNSPGAEKGELKDGGYVFGGWSRGVTINSPMTLNVTSSETNGNASVFFFNGTYATVTSYRHFGSVPLTNVRLCITDGSASVTFDNPMAYENDKTPVLNRKDAVVLIRERFFLMSYVNQSDPIQVLDLTKAGGS